MKESKIKNKKEKIFCHDCKKTIKIEGKDIKDGVLLFYKDNGEEFKIFKCNDCFSKEQGLKNFRKCEVYSRVVGYLRPVQQWHASKQEEFRQRKEFKFNKV